MGIQATPSLPSLINPIQKLFFTALKRFRLPQAVRRVLLELDGNLTHLDWHLGDPLLGYTLGDFVVDVPNKGGATSVTILATDQFGNSFGCTPSPCTIQPNGFFFVQASAGELIESISVDVSGLGVIDAFRQVRLDGIQPLTGPGS